MMVRIRINGSDGGPDGNSSASAADFRRYVDRAGVRSIRAARRLLDGDGTHLRLRDRALQVHVEQSVVQRGPDHFDPFRQNEAALELAGGNATMQINPRLVIDLTATDHQLVVFGLYRQIIHRETGDRKCDPQSIFAYLLDIVRRIPLRRVLRNPVEGALELIEAQQERTIEQRQSCSHAASSSTERVAGWARTRRPGGSPDRRCQTLMRE